MLIYRYLKHNLVSIHIAIYLVITMLAISVVAGSFYSRSRANSKEIKRTATSFHALPDDKRRVMLNKQITMFTPNNHTSSLKIESASYSELDEMKMSSSGVVPTTTTRQYSLKVQNISTHIIDVIVVSSRQNGVLKIVSRNLYKEIRNGLSPKDQVEITNTLTGPDWSVAVEAVIFRDGGYDGEPTMAEATIAHLKASNEAIYKLMEEFRDQNLLSEDNDKSIPENINLMRKLVDKELERSKLKRSFIDTIDFEIHNGRFGGLTYVDVNLKQLEKNADQPGIRRFKAKIFNRLDEKT